MGQNRLAAAWKNAGWTNKKMTIVPHVTQKKGLFLQKLSWTVMIKDGLALFTAEIDAFDSVACSDGPLTGPLLDPNYLIRWWIRHPKTMMMQCKLYHLICDEHGPRGGGPLATQSGKVVWCSTREWSRGSRRTIDMHCTCTRLYHCSTALSVQCEMMKEPLFPCVIVSNSSPSHLYTLSF